MSEYVDDELALPARQRMERHARECPECERLLAGLLALVRGLGRVPAPSGEVYAAQLAAVVRGRLDEPPAP